MTPLSFHGKEGVDGSSPSEGSDGLPLLRGMWGLAWGRRYRGEPGTEASWNLVLTTTEPLADELQDLRQPLRAD
jgi:hypothetical protein